jgi:hypothetical protein
MPYFDVDVEETRHYTVKYRVWGKDAADATAKAVNGESESEDELRCNGVLQRDVHGEAMKVPAFVRVEYDRNYYGGDYHGVGDFAFLAEDGLTDDNLKEHFKDQTGFDPRNIISYTFDETYDSDGELLDG